MAELHVIGVTHDLACMGCIRAIEKTASALAAAITKGDGYANWTCEGIYDESTFDDVPASGPGPVAGRHAALVAAPAIATLAFDEHGDLTITSTNPHHPNHDHRGARGGGEEPTVAETEKTFIPDVEQAREEHGVRLPNGREVWDDLMMPISGADLTTEQGRGKALDNWKASLESVGLEYEEDLHELEFLRRYSTVARTKVECF